MAVSHTGVHQGDAMGPLGFALALDAAENPDLSGWKTWYLDDGHIVGRVDNVADYLATLIPALKSAHLGINMAKCKVWGPGVEGDPEGWDSLPMDHPLRRVPRAPWN